jgi:hypothetical protein
MHTHISVGLYPPGGRLSVDPELECAWEDERYEKIATTGAVCTLVFGFGPVVVLAHLLRKQRARHNSQCNQSGRVDAESESPKKKQLSRVYGTLYIKKDLEIYGSLFLPFEARTHYWQLLIMTRKLVS